MQVVTHPWNLDEPQALALQRELAGRVERQDRPGDVKYASIGNRISLPTVYEWILRLCPRYRLPETTRQADQMVRAALREG